MFKVTITGSGVESASIEFDGTVAFFARVAIILVCVAIGFVGLQRSAALYDGVITLLEPAPLDLAFAILYCLSQHKR